MSWEKMIRPVYMFISIIKFLNSADTGKLRIQVDKNFDSTYYIALQ